MHVATRLTALIADDDPVFVSLATSCLATAGHDVDTASDGAAALQALEGKSYNVAIIDLAMPKIDGFRLIALIRATPGWEDLPIMVLSARNDAAAVEEAYRLGANAFETKPVNWALFPSHMRHVVRTCAEHAALKARVREAKILAKR